MRLMQVTTTQVRQNRTAFKGEEITPAESVPQKPLLGRIEDIHLNVENRGKLEEALTAYDALLSEAVINMGNKPPKPDDITALKNIGIAIVRTITHKLDTTKVSDAQIKADMSKILMISRVVGSTLSESGLNSMTKADHPILEMLDRYLGTLIICGKDRRIISAVTQLIEELGKGI